MIDTDARGHLGEEVAGGQLVGRPSATGGLGLGQRRPRRGSAVPADLGVAEPDALLGLAVAGMVASADLIDDTGSSPARDNARFGSSVDPG
jgi:hypothetical protein